MIIFAARLLKPCCTVLCSLQLLTLSYQQVHKPHSIIMRFKKVFSYPLMYKIDISPTVLTNLAVTITPDELTGKIKAGSGKQNIVDAAHRLLEKIDKSWNPALVYRWLPIQSGETIPKSYIVDDSVTPVPLTLGHSSRFIDKANYVLVAAYTAGNAIEEETQKATTNQRFLDGYLLDLIDLLVLEKTGNFITEIAENMAKELGWGVSPFLSPGSVHGWELEEQLQLAPLLPLEKIGVNIRPDAVLEPFKSLTCLIGIGIDYPSKKVGTTCQVCSKNGTCQMRQN